MSELTVYDQIVDLKTPYNEFIKSKDNIDWSDEKFRAIDTLKELKNNVALVEQQLAETFNLAVISNEKLFEILKHVPLILAKIYIVPSEVSFPVTNDTQDPSDIRRDFEQATRKLSKKIDGCLIYASIYTTRDLVDKYNNQENTILSIKNDFRELTTESSPIYQAIQEAKSTSKSVIESSERASQSAIEDIANETTRTKKDLSDFRIKLESDLKETSTSLSSNLKDDVKKELEDTKSELENVRKKADDYEVRFEKLYNLMKGMYGVVGDGKLANYNNKQANIEKISADKLRFWGMVWFGLPLILTIVFLIHYMFGTDVKLDIEWVISRFLTISVSASLSVYMLKESAAHRAKENLYRQRGTQLATIGAYLADFSDEKEKMKVKSNLVNNFYSFHDGKVDTSNVPDPNAQIKEVAEISKSLSKIFPTQVPKSKQSQPLEPDNGSQQEEQNITPINETACDKNKAKV